MIKTKMKNQNMNNMKEIVSIDIITTKMNLQLIKNKIN